MAPGINWFRNSKDNKPKKQVNPVTKPGKPGRVKSLAPKKPKKTFKGPQSPGAYKRKLYVPLPFIHADIHKRAYNGISYLDSLEAGGGMIVKMEWIVHSSDAVLCEKCIPFKNKVWTNKDDFERDRFKYGNANVIFHKNCSCEIEVTILYQDLPKKTITFGAETPGAFPDPEMDRHRITEEDVEVEQIPEPALPQPGDEELKDILGT